MKSSPLARKAAAFGASAAVLGAMVAGLAAAPAQASTQATAGKAGTAAASSKARPKVSVSTPKASSRDNDGSCPVKVDISANINVKLDGKTELAYRWLHGDGSKGKVKVLKLKGHGTKSVKIGQTLSFDEEVKGWEAVQVLGPRKVTSKKGYFSVTCQDAVVVDGDQLDKKKISVSAWADPSSYTGPCTPGDKINFVGRIKVSDPSWVKYRWVLDGRVVDYGKVGVRHSRTVSFGYSPRVSERGYAVLQVVGRDGRSSDRAYYRVTCENPAPSVRVSATNLVTATNNDGCKVGAHATINSTGRARVEYVWRVNGTAVDTDTVYFGREGSRNVELSDRVLSGDATKGGRITLTVSGPNNNDSISQSYAACVAPKPKITVSSITVGQRNDFCADKRGPGVDFKATISSSAPTTVKYYWVIDGKRENPDLERTVNGSVDVTWGIAGAQSANETKGSVSLVVVSPDAASSATTFSVTCPKSTV
ncbi:hypothetical protein [Nonomuraea guangzhouensis]|uniref:Ig-like domain-containing protein n=1 Tax=Nonomuraea guangzhouensis TaxID=1291555 RepID=A0ABW4GRP3_9ACTN|nr:hypothetical protein [Nonomuraea guangzhouensis]